MSIWSRDPLSANDSSPEEALQLAVLEAVPVDQPGECDLAVAGHGLHAVVHAAPLLQLRCLVSVSAVVLEVL